VAHASKDQYVSLCHLIERAARHAPDAVAIVCKGQTLTYKELGDKANQIAAKLRSVGVTRNSLVGLHLDRSPLMVAAILGIHRAGGAYVPLDPSYPADRLNYIVQDSGLAHLLHDGNPKITAPVKHSIDLKDQLPQQADGSGEFSTDYYDLAYVIYTSGSTGKPKGVKVHRGALVNFLQSMKKRPGLNRRDTLLAITTPSFDISALELLLPLMVGAKIILASKDEVIDGNKLAALLSDHAVTVMQATPATWRMLFAAGWSGSPNLKALCGGERLDKNLAAKLYSTVGSLWNMYGPTETTVWSACGQITDPAAPISAGFPISRTALYILDDNLEPVPIGETGELYIGGAGVALGYTDEQQTKSRFIKNPFSSKPEDRLYKTGDLASFLPDSALDIKGRVDFQVKVKRHRVELGEIEETISQFGGIDQAVVITHENQQGDNELVAFFINDEAHAIDANKLKSFLADHLPPYMVPLSYIKVSQFPLTANGKVDRISLSALYAKDSNLASAVTETFVYSNHEDLLTQIVCRISGAADLGADTNFFDAGLDSLGANQAAALFMAHASVKISVAMFFEYPTVNKLIGHLEDNRFIESVQKKMHARSNYRHSTTEPENELEEKSPLLAWQAGFLAPIRSNNYGKFLPMARMR
jgi:polyketide synthase PksJ